MQRCVGNGRVVGSGYACFLVVFFVCLAAMSTDCLAWKIFSSPFMICQEKIMLSGGPQGDGISRFLICGILVLMLVGFGVLQMFLYHFSSPDFGHNLSVCQPPRSDCYLCSSNLFCPVGSLSLLLSLCGLGEHGFTQGFCLCSSTPLS